jgi:hypothetical protein
LRQQCDRRAAGDVLAALWQSSTAPVTQLLSRLTCILLSGHGRLSDTPQNDVRIAIPCSRGLLSDAAQLFDALDAPSNFERARK